MLKTRNEFAGGQTGIDPWPEGPNETVGRLHAWPAPGGHPAGGDGESGGAEVGGRGARLEPLGPRLLLFLTGRGPGIAAGFRGFSGPGTGCREKTAGRTRGPVPATGPAQHTRASHPDGGGPRANPGRPARSVPGGAVGPAPNRDPGKKPRGPRPNRDWSAPRRGPWLLCSRCFHGAA